MIEPALLGELVTGWGMSAAASFHCQLWLPLHPSAVDTHLMIKAEPHNLRCLQGERPSSAGRAQAAGVPGSQAGLAGSASRPGSSGRPPHLQVRPACVWAA